MEKYYQRNHRFETQHEIGEFQKKAFAKLVGYLKVHSPFYKNQFQHIESQTIEDFPFTHKEDLQHRNADFLCVPRNKVLEYVTTTGTTGQPVSIALTASDLDRISYNEALSFKRMGVGSSDTVLLAVTNDRCFMAGMAYAAGAKEVGAAIIRTGPGLPELQWDTIARLAPTVLVAVPSFILKMVDFAEKHGIDYRSSSIRKVLCIGESLRTEALESNELAARITQKWPLELFSTYASTEMATAFTECKFHKGGHLNPELLIVECVDDKGKPVPPGTPGEIVVTTLGIEGMPLLRFKTGDVATLHPEPCACGDVSVRIGPILGRNKQMVKYKGTTIYPPAIKEIMHHLEIDSNYYVLASHDNLGLDKLTVFLPEGWQPMEKELKDSFRSRLRVIPEFSFVAITEIERVRNLEGLRKPMDFIDKRSINPVLSGTI